MVTGTMSAPARPAETGKLMKSSPKNRPAPDGYLVLADAARELKIATQTLRNWIAADEVRTIKQRGFTMVWMADARARRLRMPKRVPAVPSTDIPRGLNSATVTPLPAVDPDLAALARVTSLEIVSVDETPVPPSVIEGALMDKLADAAMSRVQEQRAVCVARIGELKRQEVAIADEIETVELQLMEIGEQEKAIEIVRRLATGEA